MPVRELLQAIMTLPQRAAHFFGGKPFAAPHKIPVAAKLKTVTVYRASAGDEPSIAATMKADILWTGKVTETVACAWLLRQRCGPHPPWNASSEPHHVTPRTRAQVIKTIPRRVASVFTGKPYAAPAACRAAATTRKATTVYRASDNDEKSIAEAMKASAIQTGKVRVAAAAALAAHGRR